MRKIIKKCMSVNVMLAMTIFSIVSPSNLCNVVAAQRLIGTNFCIEEGLISKQFRSYNELKKYFDRHMREIEAVQMDIASLDQLDDENIKESIDNGCVLLLNTDSFKKLKTSKFIQNNCPDILSAEYDGISVQGVSIQNSGGLYAASVYGDRILQNSDEKKNDIVDKDFDLQDVLEIVQEQQIEDSQMINKRELENKKNKLSLQVPKGYTKHNSVVCPNYKGDGTKLGVIKIVQYLYKGKKSGKKALDYAVTTFTISPTSSYGVKSFTAEMATGTGNTIIDESYLESDVPNSSYSMSATISATPSVSVGYTSSYSTSGMNIINSFAYDRKRKWICTPQSIVYEQARKIEPSIIIENSNCSRYLSKFVSRITSATYIGILGWRLEDDPISITDYLNRK